MNNEPKPDPRQHAEMLELRSKANEWLDTLVASGVGENEATSAVQLALVERLLAAGGVDKALRWLVRWQQMVSNHGAELLVEKQNKT